MSGKSKIILIKKTGSTPLRDRLFGRIFLTSISAYDKLKGNKKSENRTV